MDGIGSWGKIRLLHFFSDGLGFFSFLRTGRCFFQLIKGLLFFKRLSQIILNASETQTSIEFLGAPMEFLGALMLAKKETTQNNGEGRVLDFFIKRFLQVGLGESVDLENPINPEVVH